jgi:ADP-ribosylglycohydrolase
MDESNRFQGALIGLATGDAVGTTLEFQAPGTFQPIEDMVGGGPFRLPAGAWTDDTSMALCLAESLLERGGFDAADQMERYWRWYTEGHLSSTGTCFDIGNTVRSALERWRETGEPYSGSVQRDEAGNGSLMRLVPIPMAYARAPLIAIERSAWSSRTTHGSELAVDACRYFAGLVVGALQGAKKEHLLSPRYEPEPGVWDRAPLCPEIEDIAQGSFRTKEPPAIRGTGYVVEALEAALWAFSRSETYRSGLLMAVNLGHDADTTGAIYGQLAGAYYGLTAIPEEWRRQLMHAERLASMATGLLSLSRTQIN